MRNGGLRLTGLLHQPPHSSLKSPFSKSTPLLLLWMQVRGGHTAALHSRRTFEDNRKLLYPPEMDFLSGRARLRSDSAASGASTSSSSSSSRMLLRQKLAQLLSRIDDMSSEDEAGEEMSRTLDDAFQLCSRFAPPTHAFRWTSAKTPFVCARARCFASKY